MNLSLVVVWLSIAAVNPPKNSVTNPPNGNEISFSDIGAKTMHLQEKGYLGKGVKIAILDTGFDTKSKEVNIISGYNFVNNNLNYNDDNGHGTMITGMIAAKKNEKLLLGIAPESEIYVGKVADKNGQVTFSDLVKGINWAIEKKVNIINLSLEFYKEDIPLENVLNKARHQGIIIIASSGNKRQDGSNPTAYPAKYNNIISVGSLDQDGLLVDTSQKSKKVDIYAIGENVTGLYPNDKLVYGSAMSFSTAYATGNFALLYNKAQKNHETISQTSLKETYNQYFNPENSLQHLGRIILLAILPVIFIGLLIVVVFRLKKKNKNAKSLV
jgi:subtilisin family serine protease